MTYNKTITAGGGTSPYSFAMISGGLPPGLILSPSGVVSGTPTATGTYTFTVQATDAYGCTGTKVYSISVTN
jgi:hypothetical protein